VCKTNGISRFVRLLDAKDKSEVDSAYLDSLEIQDVVGENRENNKWVRVMVDNNFSLSSVGSASSRKFMKKYSPQWNIASRHQISDSYISRLSKRIQDELQANVTVGRNLYLSVEFDHWKDSNQRSLLGISITSRKFVHLQNLIDVSLVDHTSIAIVEQLKSSFRSIPKDRINAIVSDLASACASARQILGSDSEYPYTIQHRCMAHLLNRLGYRISMRMKSMVDWASTITAFVKAHTGITARLRHENLSKVQSYCRTRWYSSVNMIEALLEAKEIILDEMNRCGRVEQIVSFSDETNWRRLKDIQLVFRPIADCISQAERSGG